MLVFSFLTLVAAPRLLLEVARVVAIYMMVRFIGFTIFYLAGLVKIRQAEKQSIAHSQDNPANYTANEKAVHHLVVIPNYDEPLEILNRTLLSLTVQAGARQIMTVVLGMEERERGRETRPNPCRRHTRDGFYGLMATFHPADLPGESAGKATNETWAVRSAREELVERRGIP